MITPKMVVATIMLFVIASALVALSIIIDAPAASEPSGFGITVRNTTEHNLVVRVYWVDHPWPERWPRPVPVYVAEVTRGGSLEPGYSRTPGIYWITWECRSWACGTSWFHREYGIQVLPGTKTLEVKPEGLTLIERSN